MTQAFRNKLTTRNRPQGHRARSVSGQRVDLDGGGAHRPHLAGRRDRPLYVDIAIRRWRRMTSDRAINAESGFDFAALEVEQTGARHGR
jgi:hypothetical protein